MISYEIPLILSSVAVIMTVSVAVTSAGTAEDSASGGTTVSASSTEPGVFVA